jgi:hypothetical protein
MADRENLRSTNPGGSSMLRCKTTITIGNDEKIARIVVRSLI